jgi:hypothetical protein
MELDGYSPTLHLAFEHQGLQHYKRIKYFHASEAALLRIQQRDQHKQTLCAVYEVTLIVVPSILDILGIEGIKPFLKKQFAERGIPIPPGFDEKHVDLSDVYCPNRLRELQAVATQRGGKLLSVKYLGISTPLEWECAKGHRFTAVPNNVKNSGSWCPYCQGRGKTIQDMRALAAERGGKCLSEVYVNNSTPLLWECREGHQWYARPSNVVFGTWCRQCAHKHRGQQRRTRRGQQLALL